MRKLIPAVSLILVVLVLISAPAVIAANDLPKQSRDKLEDVFASVVDGLWAKTDEAFDEGRFDVSAGLCRFIVEIDPTFMEAYDIGAWMLDSDGRPGEAEALYMKNISANPKSYKPYFDLAMFYDQKRDYTKAEEYFRQATTHSAPTLVWRMLAHMREKLGDHGGALEVWETVKKMDPSDTFADPGIAREKAALEASKQK